MSFGKDIEWEWDEEQEQENYQDQEEDHELDEEEAYEEQDLSIPTLTQEEALFKKFTDVLPDNRRYHEFITGEIIPTQTLRGLNPVRLADAYRKLFEGTDGRGCGCGETDEEEQAANDEQGQEQEEVETQKVNSCISYIAVIKLWLKENQKKNRNQGP